MRSLSLEMECLITSESARPHVERQNLTMRVQIRRGLAQLWFFVWGAGPALAFDPLNTCHEKGCPSFAGFAKLGGNEDGSRSRCSSSLIPDEKDPGAHVSNAQLSKTAKAGAASL